MLPRQGWFWFIPLHEDLASVGVVAEGSYLTRENVRDPAAIFQRELALSPWIQSHLAPGRQIGSYYLTSEYTHHAKHCYAPGLLLAGDAFCFLDPVFSSGLLLALKSGVMAGETIHQALVEQDFAPEHFAAYGQTLRHGIENMRKLIYAFYNENFTFAKVISRHLCLASAVTECLAGDVDQDFSSLWSAISEVAPLPDPVPCGQPMI